MVYFLGFCSSGTRFCMYMDKPMTLLNAWNGDVAFELAGLDDRYIAKRISTATYTIVWVQQGAGTCRTDFFCVPFVSNTMLFFGPFQPFELNMHALPFDGWVYRFSNEFFCLERHRKELACNGMLFNNPYEAPVLLLDEVETETFASINQAMQQTFLDANDFAREDILYSYLKIMLVHASRICMAQHQMPAQMAGAQEAPPLLHRFKALVDELYTHHHAPSEYANRLYVPLKTLGKLTKKHFYKTPGDVVAEKLIIEAKRQLYLTENPVKEIGYSLGFRDSYYFSRFFKKHAGVSADVFRKAVGTVDSIAATQR